MGTRSMIFVTGPSRHTKDSQTFALYKHWDGYPTGNLPIIERAISRAIRAAAEANAEIIAECLTGFIIGEATTNHGMGAELEEKHQGPMQADFVTHGDLEWIYVIDCVAKTVKIYGGDLTEETKDPFDYVSRLIPTAQQREREETTQTIRLIEAWSFKVNPKSKRGRSNA